MLKTVTNRRTEYSANYGIEYSEVFFKTIKGLVRTDQMS